MWMTCHLVLYKVLNHHAILRVYPTGCSVPLWTTTA